MVNNGLIDKNEPIYDESMIERIELDGRVYSRNIIDKMHWSKKQKLKNQYRILIRNQMRLNNINKTESHCMIRIKCFLKRRIDLDNLWGGLKQFIDALSIEGFIYDDSFNYLDTAISQEKSKEFKIIVERVVCS